MRLLRFRALVTACALAGRLDEAALHAVNQSLDGGSP